ncbi:MAG TPA: sigma 54-interacting transcriptional regulator [Kofleriaceae bacterium]|nr:sigma 54-interacting transcriptional regulator [Kofleriaceae bacterium]
MTTPKQRNPEWRTQALTVTPRELRMPQFSVEVVAGPDQGLRAISDGTELAIGTNPGNQLVLTDSTVSRHHCQIAVDGTGFLLRDLGSTNGTTLAGHRIVAAYLAPAGVIGLGQTVLRFDVTDREVVAPLSEESALGDVLGESPAMRRLFFILNRVVQTDTTVLLEGETGTGKTMIAEALHDAGPRRKRPFVVVDCGAMSASLIESELFGHERGAFTGAHDAKQGMLEAANGGTIFLDEIGELPLELQPKLLRVLESRTVTRIGSTRTAKLDVRIVAATNRDLRAEVNGGTFRSDLFYRISTLRVRVPALRERPEDLAPLVDRFYRELAGEDAAPPVELLTAVARHTWPGNVRELRSFVERSFLLGPQTPDDVPPSTARGYDDLALTFRDAKARAMAEWERDWIGRLFKTYGGNLSRASRAAQMDRNHLRSLVRRYGFQPGANADAPDAADAADADDPDAK